MSAGAVHQSKRARRACQSCRARKARFEHRGFVKADRDHTLCFECYRAERERRQAQQLAGPSQQPAGPAQQPAGPAPPRLPFDDERLEPDVAPAIPSAALERFTSRQLAHRRRMLEHLQATRRAPVAR